MCHIQGGKAIDCDIASDSIGIRKWNFPLKIAKYNLLHRILYYKQTVYNISVLGNICCYYSSEICNKHYFMG